MPKCKNDPSRRYKGNEPSPKGLGYCAHAEKLGKIKKGFDGNKWIVSKTKNGIKRWIKHSKKINVKSKKKSSKKNYSALDLYDIKIIDPKKLKKYILKNKILMKIVNKIIPEITKNNINIYLVPLPMNNNNIYWSDFPSDYISNFFDQNYFKKNFIYLVIYLTKDLKINTDRNIAINYKLDYTQKQTTFDIFYKNLPYQYSWNGNDKEIMEITYKKKLKKSKKIKINKDSDFPQIFAIIWLVNKKNIPIYEMNDPSKAKELVKIKDFKKKSKFMSLNIGFSDIEYIFYGIKDIKNISNLFQKLKKKGTLTFNSQVFKIKSIDFYGYKTEEDKKQDKAFNINLSR